MCLDPPTHPLKYHILFIQNCCWITLQVSHIIKDERLGSKMEGETIFRGASRLSGTGIVECLEIVDVGCNLKQFDGLTGLILSPPPYFTTDLYATGEEDERQPTVRQGQRLDRVTLKEATRAAADRHDCRRRVQHYDKTTRHENNDI